MDCRPCGNRKLENVQVLYTFQFTIATSHNIKEGIVIFFFTSGIRGEVRDKSAPGPSALRGCAESEPNLVVREGTKTYSRGS